MKFIADNIFLIAVALISGGMLLWPALVRSKAGAVASTMQATRMMNDGALVLDVRTDKEYADGHISKARHIPLSEVAARLGEIEKFKSKPILVACERGARAGKAAQTLRTQGFANVVCLEGGMDAWVRAGLPVIKDVAKDTGKAAGK